MPRHAYPKRDGQTDYHERASPDDDAETLDRPLDEARLEREVIGAWRAGYACLVAVCEERTEDEYRTRYVPTNYPSIVADAAHARGNSVAVYASTIYAPPRTDIVPDGGEGGEPTDEYAANVRRFLIYATDETEQAEAVVFSTGAVAVEWFDDPRGRPETYEGLAALRRMSHETRFEFLDERLMPDGGREMNAQPAVCPECRLTLDRNGDCRTKGCKGTDA